MIESLMEPVKHFITSHIEQAGYPTIVILMALESANIPIPSEIILPFAGFLVSRGDLNFHAVAFAGAIGCVLGSVPSYLLGKHLGRGYLERFGSRVMISHKQLELADHWMAKYGNATAFFSRLLPVVRTFISLPMGVTNAPIRPFIILTFLGSWIWSYFLTYVGLKLGDHWEQLGPIWHKFDAVIIAILIVGTLGSAWHHIKSAKD